MGWYIWKDHEKYLVAFLFFLGRKIFGSLSELLIECDKPFMTLSRRRAATFMATDIMVVDGCWF